MEYMAIHTSGAIVLNRQPVSVQTTENMAERCSDYHAEGGYYKTTPSCYSHNFH